VQLGQLPLAHHPFGTDDQFGHLQLCCARHEQQDRQRHADQDREFHTDQQRG
jgi:hypothetical protein